MQLTLNLTVFSLPICLSCSCWVGYSSTWATPQRKPACRTSFLPGRPKWASSLTTGALTAPTETQTHRRRAVRNVFLHLFTFYCAASTLKPDSLVMTCLPNAVHRSLTMQMFLCKTNLVVSLHCIWLVLALRSCHKLLQPMFGSLYNLLSCIFQWFEESLF